MITLRYYLDARRPSRRPDGKFPIKLAVTKHGDTALLPVLAYASREEWDQRAQRLKGGRLGDAGKLNAYLARQMLRFEEILREMVEQVASGPAMTSAQIRDYIQERCFDAEPGVSLGEYFSRMAEERRGTTRKSFLQARDACGKAVPGILSKPLTTVTTRDVKRVDEWLRAHTKPSTRNTYASKLRQVLKAAHRDGITAADAGREIKIGTAVTRSRALTAEQLRVFLGQQPDDLLDREALDFFALSFYLRAINPVDLLRVGPDDVFNGRLTYTRAKTGKDYSVKVEPEAEEIIARRRSDRHVFEVPRGRVAEWYLRNLTTHLKAMAGRLGLPAVTMYWARHTFASLMLETGAAVEIIAAALGHSYGPRITMGYVTIRERAVDEAVRKVYDYVAGSWEPEK